MFSPANDVANAVGPYAVIYQVWSTGDSAASKGPVPVWILAFGGAMIVIGLATCTFSSSLASRLLLTLSPSPDGYNIMAVLGNKITLMSPSRGFTMELGAAITVILASQYGLPVSTTMCITGATLGVSLCNGDRTSSPSLSPAAKLTHLSCSPRNQLARSWMDFPRMDLDGPGRRNPLVRPSS